MPATGQQRTTKNANVGLDFSGLQAFEGMSPREHRERCDRALEEIKERRWTPVDEAFDAILRKVRQ